MMVDLFLQGQASQQIGNARIVAEFNIAKRIICLRTRFECHESKN